MKDNPEERWLPIPGYEGLYEVSDHGRILSSHPRGRPGFLKFCTSRGYSSVELYQREGGKVNSRRTTVHKIVMLAFIGHRSPGMQINHRNGIKTDNRLENLEYVTPSENKKHAFRTGLQTNCGEKSSQAKLTESDVRQIRWMISEGFKYKEIAAKFSVTVGAIAMIKSGRRWSHLKQEGGC